MHSHSEQTVRIGVSSCLLGNAVRFDGGHKRNHFLTDVLGRFAEWVPVCPEAEAGLGTPREAMRLVQAHDGARLLTVRTRRDLTAELQRVSADRAAALASLALDGYVLKKDSPSCGLLRVKTYGPHGAGSRTGRGIFATALCAALPLLPVEEDGRLEDPRMRENFVERVFAYRRLRSLTSGPFTVGDLVRFHTRHKLMLLAHAPEAYSALGRLVAGARESEPGHVAAAYSSRFMAALAVLPTRGRHTNVLRHMAGYLRRLLDAKVRRDVTDAIGEYEAGLVPLVVPATLLAHYVKVCDVRYLIEQLYLQPHPRALMLRNYV